MFDYRKVIKCTYNDSQDLIDFCDCCDELKAYTDDPLILMIFPANYSGEYWQYPFGGVQTMQIL